MKRLFFKLSSNKIDEKSPNLNQMVLNLRVFQKLRVWVEEATKHNLEVSGLGSIRRTPIGYVVSDVYLVKPSVVNSGHVAFDPEGGVLPLMKELMLKGRSLQNLRFHWHSHGRFRAFWSGDDEKNQREVIASDSSWSMSLVTNVAGEFLARMDFPKTRQEPIYNIPVYLMIPILGKSVKSWSEEYQLKHERFLNGSNSSLIKEVTSHES